jgi:hypothetical protein
MSVAAIRRGDLVGHRMWTVRFAGSMWGAFWLFRVMLFVLGPLLRSQEAAALLVCIWFSAPLGIIIAEVARRHATGDGAPASRTRVPEPATASG